MSYLAEVVEGCNMRCVSPIKLKDGPTVPCGNCMSCLKNRRDDWTFRLYEESRFSYSSHFLTLTYNDWAVPKNENGQMILDPHDLTLFLKRLRAEQYKVVQSLEKAGDLASVAKKSHKFRYYFVGEYGPTTFRPHMHGICFNIYPEVIRILTELWYKKTDTGKHPMGFIKIGDVNEASIQYVTKYMIEDHTEKPGLTKEFTRMSTKPPLGYSYLQRAIWYHKNNKSTVVKGPNGKQNLPRYYRDAIFNHEEREFLNARNALEHDQREMKDVHRFEKKGGNYFKTEFQNRKHKHDRMIKSLKHKKL